MYYNELSREPFIDIVSWMDYRDDDIKEAIEFGCTGVPGCYNRADHLFAKYFVVYDDNDQPVATVQLQRNGNIIFFIRKNVTNHIGLIRCLKELATSTVECCGAKTTKTAYWYDEAQRINKIIGFKALTLHNYFGIYYLGDR